MRQKLFVAKSVVSYFDVHPYVSKSERIVSFIGFHETVQRLSACNIAKYCTLALY